MANGFLPAGRTEKKGTGVWPLLIWYYNKISLKRVHKNAKF
jgi:hypothetical protein